MLTAMKKRLGAGFLKLCGWKAVGELPQGLRKAVVVSAPHTSNWDYIFAMLVFWSFGRKVRFLAKKELFWGPLGWLMRKTGGIPVNRKSPGGVVGDVVREIQKSDDFILMVPVEGTRKRVERWKTGFYRIALSAKVPLLIGFMDYKKKEAGFGPMVNPCGDLAEDFPKLLEFYRGVTPKHPEFWNENPRLS